MKSNPAVPGAPSGVYAARARADAQTRDDALQVTGRTRRPAAPRTWLLMLVLVGTAIAASGIAAWFLR